MQPSFQLLGSHWHEDEKKLPPQWFNAFIWSTGAEENDIESLIGISPPGVQERAFDVHLSRL
jgi:hypothetical protein